MLEIEVSIENVNKNTIPRASQLTQKTNQFNTTTRRYSEEEISNFVKSDKFHVLSVCYSDKFGDNGITGLAIMEIENYDRWRVDVFLLSCRIIGRGAEDALLYCLIKKAKENISKEIPYIILGDFNIIPAPEDVYNPKSFEDDALFRLEIRKKLREMINLGFNDVYRHFNETKEGYTFWDYMRGAWQKNNGMRIDHFLVSNSLIDQVKSININKDPRGREKPSDHTPIEITLA